MNDIDNNVKILFRFYSDLLEEETVETMWANIIDEDRGLYKIDSIPFYAPLIASDDIIYAEYDDTELMLTYRNTVEYSGNSIVRVVTMSDSVEINNIRDDFKIMGCISEKANDVFFSMEIPANVDYKIIKKKLEELEKENLIEYSEPCLSSTHKY